jgi:endonuclease/exonuclease/phosphatase family metal-dependent hydrolase
MDGRTRPARTIDVLADIDADLVALQEVTGAGPDGASHAEEIGAALGMGWVMAPVRHLRGRPFGNVVLSRLPVRQHVQYDLSWRTCEPRGCQRVDVMVGDAALHLYNVHLGTAIRERHHQAERLATIVHDRRVHGPKLVLGDFNEWMRGLATTLLSERLQSIDLRAHLKRRRTYPGFFPLLHLDHIYYQGAVEVLRVDLPRTRRSLIASDHLPLVAEVQIGFED